MMKSKAIAIGIVAASISLLGVGVAAAQPPTSIAGQLMQSKMVDCVAVGVYKYPDGSVYAVEDCNGMRLSRYMGRV